MFDYRRTHTCGELRKEDIDASVTLSGWVHRRRDHGGLIFVDLRDRFGLTQLVFDPDKDPESHRLAESLRLEWVISAKGQVIPRREGMLNPKMETGEIEIQVQDLEVLSKANPPPLSVNDEVSQANEEHRLRYRYLDIRRGRIARNLEMRHRVMQGMRSYLSREGFLEVTTPILGKSTPEGARDYLVPSRTSPGMFYALPQSPQIFKQLLMVSGMDRYFQIATCMRDEDLRADRQPEFSQLDLEMSFGLPDDLFKEMEGLFAFLFDTVLGVKVEAPFRRLTYDECIDRFGTDKPDLRFGMELKNMGDIAEQSDFGVFKEQLKAGGVIKGMAVKGGGDMSRRIIDEYTKFVGQLGVRGLAWMKMQEEGLSSNIVKFFSSPLQQQLIDRFELEAGDILLMVADTKERTNLACDQLRRKVARDRNLIREGHYEFLWVTDYPLFHRNEETGRLESEHHPFTGPHAEDLALLDSEPLKVRSSSYDLVLNGYELGSGSQRIHDTDLQKRIFELLELSPSDIKERFGFFVEALSYGTPPHLGIGLGIERIMMIMAATDNMRDVIAFPKTQKAQDLMMGAPSTVDGEQLEELEISLTGDVELSLS